MSMSAMSAPDAAGRRSATNQAAGNVTSAGWQLTLCDRIWHVSSRIVVWQPCELLYACSFLTYLQQHQHRDCTATSCGSFDIFIHRLGRRKHASQQTTRKTENKHRKKY